MDSNEALHNQSQAEASQTEPLAPPVNPFAPDDGRCVTLEEYWDKWYENPYPDIDVSYEWNNGRLEAKPSHNAPQIVLCNWFLDLLRRYIETYPDAKLINLETQGNRILNLQHLEKIFRIPACPFAFGGDADFCGFLMAQ